MPTGTIDAIGTIRVRVKQRRPGHVYAVRMIKVRDAGPIAGRWIHYARWWWEQHRGRVPMGKVVLHLDGDTLNDDPANYTIGTTADAAAIWHDANPALSDRNFDTMAKATAAMNRVRGEINRSINLLPWSWYAVDLDRRLIHNGPVRKRWMIYVRFGIEDRFARCSYIEGVALGWGVIGRAPACLLSVLADGEWLGIEQLLSRIHHFAARRYWPSPATVAGLMQAMAPVRDQLQSRRAGRRTVYRIRPHVARERGRPCDITPIRGGNLASTEFKSFARIGFLAGDRQSDDIVCRGACETAVRE